MPYALDDPLERQIDPRGAIQIMIDDAVAAERERVARHFDAKAEDARQKQMRAGNSFCSGNDWSIYGAKVERCKAVATEIRNLKPE